MLQMGELLRNRYRIVRAVKRGGMGAVYEAYDETLKFRVAVKETVADTEKLRKALEREALLLARLRHRHLPRVIDHFSGEAGHYLVMDFIDGDDLGEIVNQKMLPADRVLRWAHQLLDVVEYLHSHRDAEKTKPVIHCDIKPLNLKLTGRDDIVLLDFGLASGLPTNVAGSHLRTQHGGTPVYAPLEQNEGMRLETDLPNPKWDIYSVGATLYHLLTGFQPTPALRRMTETNRRSPDPLETAHKKNAKKISLALSDVIAKAMALDADDRYATIGELRTALHAAESAVNEPIVPPPIVVSQLAPSFVNAIGMAFVLVPSGKFVMGSTEADEKRWNEFLGKYKQKRDLSDERPAHEVTIGSPFYLGKYQVTQGEWKSVMRENPSSFTGDDRLPVETVSWDDCQEFIKRLNAKKDGYVYRLPSEAEWEYACRAGTTGDYGGELDEMGWYGDNSGDKRLDAYQAWTDAGYDGSKYYETFLKPNNCQAHPVGRKRANGFGLYDMHGNVWEWCQDRWRENYNGAPSDGSAWEQGSDNSRVLRGGSWRGRENFFGVLYCALSGLMNCIGAAFQGRCPWL